MKTSSAILLLSLLSTSTSFAQTGLEGFSSGRYEIRKSSSKRMPASETALVTDSDGVKVRTLKESELAAEEKAHKEAAAAKEEAAKAAEASKIEKDKTVISQKVEITKVETVVDKSTLEVQEPSIGEQAESLFSNKAEKIYDFYREQVHPDDIRNNKAELDFAPVLIYNDSQSNYSFRDYNSFFNALKIKAAVWFTPLIGVSGQMLFSMGADVDSMDADKSRVPAKYEFTDLAVNFRRFFGVSRKSNSVEFSVILSENKMTVPSDNTSRARLKTSGVGIGLKTRLPSSANYSWVMGGTFFPRLQHDESETGVAINSGTAEDTIRLGLDFGGEWKFDREGQMTWNLGTTVERNVFADTASLPDPSTGSTPSNVSVTNTLYMFSLGYRWGH
ncbi:hypothetical protein [Bdellovibrio reynosensis]|uniref:Outer membrane protein beta-barrel domain-containing protein n=1 Tax=Bdellovibrio reynosensis TaxID=2835041 RepID=A0ABY4CDN9_9BACT|nr:hypothetical protein [Bdellovibrio reynosensis]UOF00310.1 hypothetical protein MNR06_11415 [Bdellovibrio reynosensis]